MEDERRRHSRKPVMLEAELTVDGETTPAKCVDISLGGAQLLVKPPPAYGTVLTVKIQVSAKVALTLPATARWSGPVTPPTHTRASFRHTAWQRSWVTSST